MLGQHGVRENANEIILFPTVNHHLTHDGTATVNYIVDPTTSRLSSTQSRATATDIFQYCWKFRLHSLLTDSFPVVVAEREVIPTSTGLFTAQINDVGTEQNLNSSTTRRLAKKVDATVLELIVVSTCSRQLLTPAGQAGTKSVANPTKIRHLTHNISAASCIGSPTPTCRLLT